MPTATLTTPIDHTTNAGYNAWVSELITLLFTTLGLTQTADTGQTNGTGLTVPATNTMNAYVVGRFNDTAQSTTPIFFRLDFGTGGGANYPQIRLTVGTGSNGSGTITGQATLTGMGITNNVAAASPTNPYITRACYNPTAGVFWLGWKQGGNPSYPATCLAGLLICRSADSTGAVTTDAFNVLTNAGNANSNGSTNSSCYLTAYSHLTSASYNGSPFPSTGHSFVPFLLTSTIYSGNAQIFPAFQYTPVLGISPWWGLVVVSELGVGATTTAALVGTGTHTYINAGGVFGTDAGFGTQNLAVPSTYGNLMLWE